MNTSTLLVLSLTYSFICSLNKCLLNVFYVPRTVQNTGERWQAKIHAFMEPIIYCERNTCVKVIPSMGTYTWGKYYEGRDLGGLEGGVEDNKPNGPGSFPGKENTTQQTSHSDLKATSEVLSVRRSKGGVWLGRKIQEGCRPESGF